MMDSSLQTKKILSKIKSPGYRVTKSPSPDSTLKKTLESNCRTSVRRSVPASPSKSPEIVPRRAVTDIKGQVNRLTRRSGGPGSSGDAGANKISSVSVKGTDEVDAAKSENQSTTAKKNDLDDRLESEERSSVKKQTSDAERRPPPSTAFSASTARAKQAAAKKGNSPLKSTKSDISDNLVACHICERRFASDRIDLHKKICEKSKKKTRKQFDSSLFRVRGTELEQYSVKKPSKKHVEKAVGVKVDWRKKHNDLINAIRSAKQVQEHLAKGGRLTDLPPPPRSDTSDYIQCPHCKRKFNQGAAERHIPICQERTGRMPNSQATKKRPR